VPPPKEDDLASWYSDDYFEAFYGGDREAATRRHESLLDGIRRRVGSEGVRLLDVGCGVGDLCIAARRRGWVATGVESSPAAARRAAARGVPVVEGEAATCLEAENGAAAALSGSFDLVVFRDSLTHIPRAGAALTGALRRLRAGGWLAIRAPNRHPAVFRAARLAGLVTDPSGILHLPLQVLHLDRAALSALLAGQGLEQIAVEGDSEAVARTGGRYSASRPADLLWRLFVRFWERRGEPEALWGWGRRA
jgi:SAM-dependent methyltransferase